MPDNQLCACGWMGTAEKKRVLMQQLLYACERGPAWGFKAKPVPK